MKYDGERLIGEKIPENIWRLHFTRYEFAKDYVKEKSILDIACGIGYGSDYLTNYAKEVVGGDISLKAIKFGKKHRTKTNREFIALDVQALPFKEQTFDTIISFETIEHLSNPWKFLSDCYRLLKKKGTLICSTYNRNILTPRWISPMNPFHIKEFTKNEFWNILARYFDNVSLYGHLFLDTYQRFTSMLYHTFGFLSIRSKTISFVESLISALNLNVDPYLSSDFTPRRVNKQHHQPAYLIAICRKME